MSVLLYSGGLDAYCIDKIFEPQVKVFVDPGTKEALEEFKLIQEADNGIEREDIKHVTMHFLSQFEDDDKIIPFRNSFFAMAGAFYDRYVMLGATRGDGVDTADTTHPWASATEAMLNAYATPQKQYEITLPARSKTKAELVSHTVERPGIDYEDILSHTKSCHYGTVEKGCGECFGCLRRYVAFEAHTDESELTTAEILDHFEKDPVTHVYEDDPERVVNNFARRDREFDDFMQALKNRGYKLDNIPNPSVGVRDL